MTVAAIIIGLIPVMVGSGTGSEVMRRIAAPMVGGVVSATVLTLVLLPAIFLLKTQRMVRRQRQPAATPDATGALGADKAGST